MSLATLLLSDRISAIDFKMAESILDRLGYSIEDLSLNYPDVVFENGEISHQLWYGSIASTCNIMGYICQCNGVYYVSGNRNYATYQQAALELLNPNVVEDCRFAIELERSMAVDYM
jgi:hypothetical protein